MSSWSRNDIVDFIRNELLLQRLDLAASGVSADELTEQAPLMAPPISVDSVDAIDLLVGVERKFNLPPQELTPDLIKRSCASIGSLADYVCEQLSLPQPIG
jgi:acyl carrier protein